MRADDLDYDLDPALIAQSPAVPRDAARLLVYDRASRSVEHRFVRDLPECLRRGDALVVNETTVAPVRIKALRQGAGTAHVEGLLLARRGQRTWLALLKNAKRVREGERLAVVAPNGRLSDVVALHVMSREADGWLVELEGSETGDAALESIGWTPLPPYILKSRRDAGRADDGHDDGADRARYQTVFARPTDQPSVAAPTAGLHFTRELLDRLATVGVERIAVSLQVGAGTFKTVESERVEDHPMHSERCIVSGPALERVRGVLAERRRIVAVGTTTVRTLESIPTPLPPNPGTGVLSWDTDILIQPGYAFTRVGAILTNFHLPRSTLLALVAAFVGLDEMKRIYALAITERYRFYSFGDAMLLL